MFNILADRGAKTDEKLGLAVTGSVYVADGTFHV